MTRTPAQQRATRYKRQARYLLKKLEETVEIYTALATSPNLEADLKLAEQARAVNRKLLLTYFDAIIDEAKE